MIYRMRPPFETVYEENYIRLYRYAYMLLLNREDAEDIVSETFLSAYKHYGDYDPEKGSIITWLSHIAHNKAVNLLNLSERKKRGRVSTDMEEGEEDPKLTRFTDGEDAVAACILSRLTLKEREFLDLRYGCELSDKEIAGMLGEKENTISKRYQRLLQKCKFIAGMQA
ncbi:MAG TPA: hypothetical protein DCL38_06435 [Lachnospiraceae bacterium]|nr:hypothetical protein [Lachnospiraceae bacterium]